MITMDIFHNTEALTGWTLVGVFAVVFQILSEIVDNYLSPSIITQSSPSKTKSKWRWKNISVSLVHSVTSGLWACSCFYFAPKMAEDMIGTYTTASQILISYSVGYFVYDVIDMLRFNPSRQSYELLLHHVVIITCLSVCISTQQYIAYATVALVIEINSIFLHIRQLLQIYGFSRNSPVYRANSLINLGTYILFRLATVAWMSRWLLKNHHLVPLALYSLGSIGLAIMTVMNIILFYRLLQSDFIRKREKLTEQTVKEE